MRILTITGQKKFDLIAWASILLLAIAYSTHLTYLLIDSRTDEVRRALISVELMLRGDYFTPTLYGELYLNKPPLYNWLIIGSYKIFGINELGLRLPVILAIFFYGAAIYHFTSKYISKTAAIVAALFFMTNGRILIYDSLLGLIDIFFSSLVYIAYMLIYYYGTQKKWYKLFIYTYLIVAAGFLMKGLPSLVLQGFALLVFFISTKQFKVLFHKAHFMGLAVLAAILGVYYTIYFSHNQLGPMAIFNRLVTESTQRTVVNSTTSQFLLHVLSYPITFFKDFAPWTIFALLFFRKSWFAAVKANPFIWYNALVFFSSIFIYWLSPNIMARYLFMLIPLFFTVTAWYYVDMVPENDRFKQVLNKIIAGILVTIGVGCLLLPFLNVVQKVANIWPKAVFSALIIGGAGYLAFKQKQYRLIFIILGVVAMRVAFNWFVIAQRGEYTKNQVHEAKTVFAIAGSRTLYLEKDTDIGNSDYIAYLYALDHNKILEMQPATNLNGLYITDSVHAAKGKILHRWEGPYQPNLYLVDYQKGN